MRSRIRTERNNNGIAALGCTAPNAPPCHQRAGMQIQPLDNATFERVSLGIGARQSAIELCNGCTLLEVKPPIVCRPAISPQPQQLYDLDFVPGKRFQDSAGWRRWRFQQQIVAIHVDLDADGSSFGQNLDSAHSLPLHPGAAFFALGEAAPSV
jgi:hypothetical protein